LKKPIFFSPLLQNLWTHLAVLAVPAGTFWLFPCLHPLPLDCTDFPPLYPDFVDSHPPRCFAVDSPIPPHIFRSCTTTGRQNHLKGKNVWRTLSNLPQDNCFMPLPNQQAPTTVTSRLAYCLHPCISPAKLLPTSLNLRK